MLWLKRHWGLLVSEFEIDTNLLIVDIWIDPSLQRLFHLISFDTLQQALLHSILDDLVYIESHSLLEGNVSDEVVVEGDEVSLVVVF